MIVIDTFIVDIAVTERHIREAQATRHPIEEGSDVTDHVILRPFKLQLDCVVSDTPTGELFELRRSAGFLVGDADQGFVPSDDAHDFLARLYEERRPVSIDTSLGTVDNMLLIGVSEPRSAEDGDSLRFEAMFQQVRIIQTERRTVLTLTPRSRRKVNRGNKGSATVNDPNDPNSKKVKAKPAVADSWALQAKNKGKSVFGL